MWGNINITLFYVLLIMTLLIITGCSNSHNGQENIGVEVTENPDAEEVLSLDSDADIFQFDDVIYKTDVDWVEEKTLTKNKQVGETEVTTSILSF